MSYTVRSESFDSLSDCYQNADLELNWEPLFVIPAWLKVWWDAFGEGFQLFMFSVSDGDTLIGIAPLMRKDSEARFIGSSDVCDYLDFVIVPGREQDFYTVVLDHLKENGIESLGLESMRPDSTVMTFLTEMALSHGLEVTFSPNDVTVEMPLPETWDDYLQSLNTKQRHEVRRKLRRLEESGQVNYRCIGTLEEVQAEFDTFIKFFVESRTDKAEFLTGTREKFFRTMAPAMAEAGLFRLGILELDGKIVAMIMFFDLHGTAFLYNSGYETDYHSLSVGLMSKVLCIKESIESGKKVFDFLKGDEVYKTRLGGVETRLSDCRIAVKK